MFHVNPNSPEKKKRMFQFSAQVINTPPTELVTTVPISAPANDRLLVNPLSFGGIHWQRRVVMTGYTIPCPSPMITLRVIKITQLPSVDVITKGDIIVRMLFTNIPNPRICLPPYF